MTTSWAPPKKRGGGFQEVGAHSVQFFGLAVGSQDEAGFFGRGPEIIGNTKVAVILFGGSFQFFRRFEEAVLHGTVGPVRNRPYFRSGQGVQMLQGAVGKEKVIFLGFFHADLPKGIQ
jgi:hypothetical protein